jgi:sigma-B regulation protein RsbU (phosphoserine phosphatase)
MALTVTLLRAEACRTCSPGDVLSSVNQQLIRFNDEGMFVTILYGVLDILTGEFIYVRAGHEQPVLYTDRGRLIEVSLEPGQPLGLFSAPILSEQMIHIQQGITLLLYTDGVTESVNAEDEMFGTEHLRAVVGKYNHQSAQTICERVLEGVNLHRGEASQSDDVTLLCVRTIARVENNKE